MEHAEPQTGPASVTTAVFDLGNVLITWGLENLYRSVITDDERRRWFLDNVLTMEENAKLDGGMPLADVTADLARRHPDWSDEIDCFRTRWVETLGPVIETSVRILADLRHAQVPVYALSNWGAETFELARPKFGFFEYFDDMVISGQVGVTKPDPAIWNLLLDRHDLVADDCVFIDDSAANIAAARELGFATVHFGPHTDLRTELRAVGLPL